MIFSLESLFSNNQALSGAGAAASTNYIDRGAAGTPLGAPVAISRDAGKGRPIPISVRLAADAGGTGPTLDADLEMDDNSAFSSATVLDSITQISGGLDGDEADLYFVPQGATERYLRINYTLGGTSPTYTVHAGFVFARQTA